MPSETAALALGEQALQQNNFAEAERWFRLAVTNDPQSTVAMRGLGYALVQQNQLADALPVLKEAVRSAPGDLLVRLLFGRLCLRLQEPAAAEKHFQRILKKIPNSESALSGLVDAAMAQNKPDDAQRMAKRSLALNPRSEVAFISAAHVAEMQGDYDTAQTYYDQIVELVPGNANLRYQRSLSLLRRGQLPEGWREYEYRFAAGKVQLPPINSPRWVGESLGHLLIVAEQGLGDAIQFARFIRQARSRTQRLTLACQPSQARLLARSFGIETIDLAMPSWPEHDAHLPLMSLPHILDLGQQVIPSVGRYLQPDAMRTRIWAERLALKPGRLHVGIVYATSIAHATEQYPQTRRSCTVADLDILAELENVDFYNLQVGISNAREEKLSQQWHDPSAQIDDFDDTAAIIDLLDIVVSVDTAVAHVVGGLNKPLALLLPHTADWRWRQDSDSTAWYPSTRLFRQAKPGRWSTPLHRLRDFLALEASKTQR